MKTPTASLTIASAIMLALIVAVRPVGTQSGSITDIGVRGRANAYASIASSGSFVGVAWAARTKDGVTDVYTATSRDAGRTYGPPVRVNQAPGDASVSGEQPPRIVLSARASTTPAIVVMWTAKGTSGTRLVSARSVDGGTSFGAAASVPGSEGPGNRGWQSAAVTPKGDVLAVWLDHREVPARAPAAPGAAHQHSATGTRSAAEGVARAHLSKLFFARLNDQSAARSIAPGVCYCCKTSIATGPGETIVAAWRHVYPGNIRDIALARSSDGGRTFEPPVRVSEDNWVLDGCPENGPAIAVDPANAIHIVWSTLVPESAGAEESLALFYATSKDGQHFTKRQQIPTGSVPRHPQIALGPGGTITVAWDEQLNGERRIVVAQGTRRDGKALRFVRRSDEPGTYPAIASSENGAFVAWMSGTAAESVVRIERHLP